VYVFNFHTAGLSSYADCNFNGLAFFFNKVLALKNDGIYEKSSSSSESRGFDVTVGSIDLRGKCYTTDAVLQRTPVKETTMQVTNKEGLSVDYTFAENTNKINLAKGHQSRYFSFNLKSTENEEVKELKIVLEELDTIE